MNTPTPVGIDLGKRAIHVAIANAPMARNFTLETIDLTAPDWRELLSRLVPDHALVVLEPTGTHYAAPILAALPNVQIYFANHDASKHTRQSRLSKSKTDSLDARALAMIARDLVRKEDTTGVRRYDPAIAQPAQALRMMVNNYVRATRERTRALNRLDALLHGIAPEIVKYKEALAAIFNDAQTTNLTDLLMLDRPEHINAQHWGHRNRVLRKMEAFWREPSAPIRLAILMTSTDLAEANARQERAHRLMTAALSQPPFLEIAALWSSVPGMNAQTCAALLVACGGDPRRVTRDQFTRSCGVAPSRFQSGAVDRTSREARPGYRPAMLYLHLHMLILLGAAAPKNNPIANYRARGKSGGACKRKLAAILWGITRSGQPCNWR